MLLPIAQYGEAILRRKGDSVDPPDVALNALAADMLETMKANHGVGLAAQQVRRAVQLCVVDLSYLDESHIDFNFTYDDTTLPLARLMPLVILNPKLTLLRSRRKVMREGCLSFPGLHLPIRRPHAIHLEFQDLEGISHTLACDGFFARVIQHEVDHLEGILYIDRVARLKAEQRVQLNRELKERERRGRQQDGPTSPPP